MPCWTTCDSDSHCSCLLQETARANGGRGDAFHEAVHEVLHALPLQGSPTEHSSPGCNSTESPAYTLSEHSLGLWQCRCCLIAEDTLLITPRPYCMRRMIAQGAL